MQSYCCHRALERWRRSPLLPDIDAVIHAPARLGMVALLAALPAGDELAFSELQDLLGLSPGNLSTHLRKLEEGGYVVVAKTFRDRTPVTSVSLTERGRAALRTYASALSYYLDGSAAEDLLRMEGSS